MKRLLNGGAAGQIVLIIVLAVVAAHAFSTAIRLTVDLRPGPPPEIRGAIAKIALLVDLLDNLSDSDRAPLLAAARRAGVTVKERAGLPVANIGGGADFPAHDLQQGVSDELGLRMDDVRTIVLPAARRIAVFLRRPASGSDWTVFELDDVFPDPGHPRLWLSPSDVASMVLIVLLIGLSSLWATRKVTTPLVRLAHATESMNILQDPPPVVEEGTREVRQVAHAFNVLLERLRSIVAERTQMLASVSHDLRTPLTRLRLQAEALQDPSVQGKMLNDIRRMEAMLVATLAFLREEAAHESFERVDIAVLLQTICDEFNDAGTDVRYEGPLHAPASCRPLALQRALINLIDNAAQFQGWVTVRLGIETDGLVIAVEDDGPGIPDDQKAAVFKPFYRGDASRSDPSGHMGLGLSIVDAVVQSHNGEIKLLDRQPHGLRVQITLPHTQA